MSHTQMLLSNLESAGAFPLFRYPHSTSETPKSSSVIGMNKQVSIFARNLVAQGVTRLTSHLHSRSRSCLVDRLLVLVEGDRHV
jgi:hypothetical protein